ncbi:MAG: hypothetical protein RIT45_3210 [Pseudomonadota bacterium]
MSNRPVVRLALALATLATSAIVAPAAAHAGTARTLVPPTHTIGEVRAIHLRRVEKALRDTLSFSGKVTVLAEPTPVDPPKKGKKVDVLAVDPRIQKADLARQEGTDLALAGNHGKALPQLQKAIKLYEASYAELADYTKLADAYARAGVSAFVAGKGKARAAAFFDAGLTLQPTLAIDRRNADKALLELFDARREAAEKTRDGVIELEGEGEGAIVFIDGVRAGGLPSRRDGLPRGTHYVQVRAEGFKTFAKKVRVGAKPTKVKVKLKALKVAKDAGLGRILGFADVEGCVKKGEFSSRDCRRDAGQLCKQTAADFLLYSVLVADRYGRLTLHAFLQRADGKVVAMPEREIDKNLSDVAARITELSNDVGAAVANFPVDRALAKKPKLFR